VKANVELPLGLIGDEEDKTAYKAILYNLAGQIRQQIEELLAEASTPRATQSAPTPQSMPTPRQADSRSAPARLVCLEIAGASPDVAKVKNGVHDVLKARNVSILSPPDLGAAPRDPLLAERFLQNWGLAARLR
jgi:hypothetical protein